jgi:hypothetical protein
VLDPGATRTFGTSRQSSSVVMRLGMAKMTLSGTSGGVY